MIEIAPYAKSHTNWTYRGDIIATFCREKLLKRTLGHLYYNGKPSVGVSVCLSVGMFPRHGYSFKDTTVWSSPNDSKCLRLGVSVLKISNLPIPEVAFNKNVKIS